VEGKPLSTAPAAHARSSVEPVPWDDEGGRLVKVVKKANFAEALAYVNAVGALAEARNHHPDIEISWNTVTLRLWTHSAGAVTDADHDLAAAIDTLDGS
jgi:4a-hydroxytetrahydrobiopterin dehydratase